MRHELMMAIQSVGCRANVIQGSETLTDKIAPCVAQVLEAFILLSASMTQW
jgi:hypothetical protein